MCRPKLEDEICWRNQSILCWSLPRLVWRLFLLLEPQGRVYPVDFVAVQSVVPLERPIMRLPRGPNRLVPLLSRRMLRMILGELSELRQRARLLPHIPVWIKDENNLNINYLILFFKFSKDSILHIILELLHLKAALLR